MGNTVINSVVTILTAIIGVAILAVILSKKSTTVNVIQSGGSFLSSILGQAVSPVSN